MDKENIPNNNINTPKRKKEENHCPDAPLKKLKHRGLRSITPQRPVALQKLNFTDADIVQVVPHGVLNQL